MSHESQPTDARLREELVAYLDGELPDEDHTAIESRIASDQDCRAEMQRLERAWNALDVLPRATVDDAFTQTTMEMATVEAQREVSNKTAMMPARKRSRRLRWIALAAAAAVAGFAVGRAVVPNPNRTLYDNLPLITEFDSYNQHLELAFLERLPEVLPAEFDSRADPAVAQRAATLGQLSVMNYRERARYVDELPAEQRYDLAASASRWEGMNQDRRQDLSQLHEQIAGDDDSQRLWHAMLVYWEFASELPAAEQANLRSLPTDARLARFGELAARAQWRGKFELSAANAQGLRIALRKLLADDDLQADYDALHSILNERSQAFLQGLAQRDSLGREKFVILMSARADDKHNTPEFQRYATAMEKQLLAGLDETARERLHGLPAEHRGQVLLWWLADAHTRVSAEDLEEFFASEHISDEQRHRLLAMPKDEMQRALRELYAEAYHVEGRPGGFLPRGFLNRRSRGFYNDRERRGPPGPGGPPDERGQRLGPGPGPPGPDQRRGPREGGRGGPPRGGDS